MRQLWCLTYSALLLLSICSCQDLVVSIGSRVLFYPANGTETEGGFSKNQDSVFEPNKKAKVKTVSAADSGLFYSQVVGTNSFIYYAPFENGLPNQAASQLLLGPHDFTIESLAYVQSIFTLFWTESATKVIHKAVMSDKSVLFDENDVFMKLGDEDLPKSLVYDECSSRLFWTNWNYKNPSIESVFINGTERRDVVRNALYQPHGLAIFGGRLFFTNSKPGDSYDIESVAVDGTNRQVLVKGYDQHPVSLAVSASSVFWSDSRTRSVWYLPDRESKSPESKLFMYGGNEAPTSLAIIHAEQSACYFPSSEKPNETATAKNVYANNYLPDENDLCANYCVKGECRALGSRVKFCDCHRGYSGVWCENEICPPGYCANNGVCRPQDGNPVCICLPGYQGSNCEIDLCHQYCLNSGKCDIQQNQPVCQCGVGYRGERCEKSVCEDHCLNGGECLLAGSGPSCLCPESYLGNRCQESMCDNFCLNGGSCSVANKTAMCHCEEGWYGDRCEKRMLIPEIVCRNYCFNGGFCVVTPDGEPVCSCETGYDGMRCEVHIDFQRDYSLLGPLIACSVLSFLLLVGVVGMAFKMCKLYRRPRTRKHVFVNKPKPTMSIGPTASDGIQLELENCCNMNVCETPCFEPKTRQISSRYSKKDEKYNLLKASNELF